MSLKTSERGKPHYFRHDSRGGWEGQIGDSRRFPGRRFWSDLKEIAGSQQATLSNVVAEIDNARQRGNLSPAIRLFVRDRVRAPATSGLVHLD